MFRQGSNQQPVKVTLHIDLCIVSVLPLKSGFNVLMLGFFWWMLVVLNVKVVKFYSKIPWFDSPKACIEGPSTSKQRLIFASMLLHRFPSSGRFRVSKLQDSKGFWLGF